MDESTTFADEPITDAAADVLTRAPFVASLQSVLLAWDGKSSLVVGLHGGWGEGKTSVLNLLTPLLRNTGLDVLRFSPWEWSSMRDLHDAFFDDVAAELGQRSRRDAAETAKAWRRYAARLKGVAGTADLITPVLKLALAVAAVLSFIGTLHTVRVLYIALLILSVVALAFNWLSKLVPALAEIFHPSDNDLLPSLDKLKKKLREALLSQAPRLLVVFDDLDRLTPDQLADVITLVKANGDLPGLCYLLVGDRVLIADHISKKLGVDGSEYLEKIIQLSFDLPAIEQRKLNSIFFSGLDNILSSQPRKGGFDAERWPRIFWTGIAPSLKTLRSVQRLLATLRVNIALLTGEAAFEVDQVDFVALETIRVFEPVLYRTLRRSKSALTPTSIRGDRQESEERIERILSELTVGVHADSRESWRDLLRLLFPSLSVGALGVYIDADAARSFARQQRICSPVYFDRYFRFGTVEGEISSSCLLSLIERHTRDEYRSLLAGIASEGKLPNVIARLRERLEDVPSDSITPLIIALSDVGDELAFSSNQMFGSSDSQEAEFLIQKLIDRLSANESRMAYDSLFRSSSGVRLPLEVFRNLLGKLKESRLPATLTERDIEQWKTLFVEKLQAAALSGELMKLEGAGPYLYLWSAWGSPEEVREFVSKMLQERDSTLTFLKALVQISHISDGSGEKQKAYIRHTDISRFADPEEVYRAINISDELDQRLLRAFDPSFEPFEAALKRYREGVNDEGFVWENNPD